MVHPKVKIMSFIHPHDFPNLYEFLLLNIKEDILKNVGTQIAAAAIDFHSKKKMSYYGNQWLPANV